MPEFALNLNTDYSFMFFILMVIFIGFTYFIYRYTNPPISRGLRIFLFILRAVAFCVLIFMMTEPIASFTKTRTEEPIIALLVDKSASMNLKDNGQEVSRFDIAKDVVNGEVNLSESLSGEGIVAPYLFAKEMGHIQEDWQMAQPDGGTTNIGDAFYSISEEMAQQNLSAVVLVSDGENNSGADPVRAAKNLGVPIYSVGIGDPTEPKDVAITKFITNEIAYVNNKIPVEVTIQTNGFSGGETTISLRENNKTLDSRNLNLTDTFQEHKILLHFTPKTEGLHKFTLTIPEQDGEKITQNNSRVFFVNVLKSKMKVLYIDGAPNWDYNFIRNTLERDPNVEITSMAMIKSGEFYEQTSDEESRRPAFLPNTTREWNEYDLVMLGDISLRHLNANQEKMLADFVNEQGKAVLFLGGKNALSRGEYQNSPLKELLPVGIQGGSIQQPFQIELTSSGKQNPLMMLDDNVGVNERLWHEFPPILSANKLAEAKPGAAVLAVHPIEETPLIATLSIGRGKTMIIGMSSLWRWSFLMEGIGKSSRYFERFMGNVVRWLVTREIDKQVKISTDKIVYRSGEEISFTAQVYNSNYEPIDDATVEVNITQKDNADFKPVNISLISTPTGEGTYTSKFNALPPGDYQYYGSAEKGERIIGKDAGKFTVGEYSLEYENTELNEEMLKKISAITDGKYYTYENVDELPDDLDVEERKITRTKEVAIWDNVWFFLIFIGLLGVEWTIRKRRGLA